MVWAELRASMLPWNFFGKWGYKPISSKLNRDILDRLKKTACLEKLKYVV
jgi:hypothetical protein